MSRHTPTAIKCKSTDHRIGAFSIIGRYLLRLFEFFGKFLQQLLSPPGTGKVRKHRPCVDYTTAKK